MRKFSSLWTAKPFVLAATISLFAATDIYLSSASAESTPGNYDTKVAGSTKATKHKTEKRVAPIVVAANSEKMNGAGIDKSADEPIVEPVQQPDGPRGEIADEPSIANDTPQPAQREAPVTEASNDDPEDSTPSPFGVPAASENANVDTETSNSPASDTATAPSPFANNDEPSTATNTPAQQGGSIEVAARPTEGDIFGQWAAKKLKRSNEGRNIGPHPLARDYPDHYVVVCQAGCRTPNEQIVYMEAQSARNPIHEPTPENAQNGNDYIACVGGCYKVGTNAALYHVNGAATGSGSGSWMSTGTEASTNTDANAASGRWYERINGDSSEKEPPETGN